MTIIPWPTTNHLLNTYLHYLVMRARHRDSLPTYTRLKIHPAMVNYYVIVVGIEMRNLAIGYNENTG